jgi:two-component system phosphate regulon sensor histidine kinase PhoR
MLKKSYCKLFFINLLGILIVAIFFLGYVPMTKFIFAILLGILVTFFLSYRFIKNIVEPIKEITEITKDIAKGIYSHRLESDSIDEIKELSLAVDSMAKLEAILKSIVNGVIAFDNNEKILLINDAARKILNIKEKDLIGRHILEIVRNS